MCLILFGYRVFSGYEMVMAANRDEFYARPTAPMTFWEESPGLLAGKDLEQGGTWFGVARNGRFAALTNYRDPSAVRPNAVSRGQVVTDFLLSDMPADRYAAQLERQAANFNGFNLLYGTGTDLYCFSNVSLQCRKVAPGIHGLSNGFLDTPWPKVEKGKQRLAGLIDQEISKESLFNLLSDRKIPHDGVLPDTGVGIEWERILSPLFIESQGYGTRSSTVMLVESSGRIDVTERTYLQHRRGGFEDRQFEIEVKPGQTRS